MCLRLEASGEIEAIRRIVATEGAEAEREPEVPVPAVRYQSDVAEPVSAVLTSIR